MEENVDKIVWLSLHLERELIKNTDVASFEFHILPMTEQPESFGDNATIYACNAMKTL